ncbi:hypothetical protein [Cyclobacterium marinum]|uniref:Phosphoesterase PA-phosphatase-like protein n=1 Tax=Cyclobacterium marinum (strain ATCC 25205 / DSM 745 / LMG 13164 / NCIMB 1802) TaxID=880070 RepID=G0J002_CYCMS|nr:hypothetical protein [Cyclobacterium marinum]AEL26504.1 phosphoesterase PA-phosphatase-like protein [Cyclobacterium marinum DSM 745]MBR9776147.1 hypothetical protein [Cytophagales bacterium]
MKNKIARIISQVGHPLLLILAFLIYFLFSIHNPEKAILTFLIILFLGILPLVFWNLIRTKKGLYSNFDVSIRSQRNSMYLFVLTSAFFVLLALWANGQPDAVLIGSAILIQLLCLAFVINFKSKVSLHVAITIFTAFGFWEINPWIAIGLWISSPLIAWSRWQLRRHEPMELIWGLLLGLICGIEILTFI